MLDTNLEIVVAFIFVLGLLAGLLGAFINWIMFK